MACCLWWTGWFACKWLISLFDYSRTVSGMGFSAATGSQVWSESDAPRHPAGYCAGAGGDAERQFSGWWSLYIFVGAALASNLIRSDHFSRPRPLLRGLFVGRGVCRTRRYAAEPDLRNGALPNVGLIQAEARVRQAPHELFLCLLARAWRLVSCLIMPVWA